VSKIEIRNLKVSVTGENNEPKQILKGVDLIINEGEIHAIMGPNGSGKSTLSYTLMGHPHYTIDEGEILFDGENINELTADKRSKLGIFLAMQYPVEIPGVSVSNFIRQAINAKAGASTSVIPAQAGIQTPGSGEKVDIRQYIAELNEKTAGLDIDKDFLKRAINVGFSGGEKKRAEILQLQMLKPKFAILDETDSGLDVDALRVVSEGINKAYNENSFGILLVTHYTRILQYIKPHFVHVFSKGKIAKSGDASLAQYLEDNGYKDFE
jgi:Fe-S cluster assembly ATP-binding protein